MSLFLIPLRILAAFVAAVWACFDMGASLVGGVSLLSAAIHAAPFALLAAALMPSQESRDNLAAYLLHLSEEVEKKNTP